jgi:hypothetical protein
MEQGKRFFFGILQNRSCTKGERCEPFVQLLMLGDVVEFGYRPPGTVA